MHTNQAGKGDKRRPQQISEQEMAARWAAAFGERPVPPKEDKC